MTFFQDRTKLSKNRKNLGIILGFIMLIYQGSIQKLRSIFRQIRIPMVGS